MGNGSLHEDVFEPEKDAQKKRVERMGGVPVLGNLVTSPKRKTGQKVKIVEGENGHKLLSDKPDAKKLLRVPFDINSDDFAVYVNAYQIERAESRRAASKPNIKKITSPAPVSEYEELPADKMSKKRIPPRVSEAGAPDIPHRSEKQLIHNINTRTYIVYMM